MALAALSSVGLCAERISAASNVTAANQTARLEAWDLNGREKGKKSRRMQFRVSFSEALFLGSFCT
jgi:hypothetical protein